MKVSIVIPTYKRVDYLDRLLRSIEVQTFKDFEVIVVDDNSPNIIEYNPLIEKYKNIFKELRFITKKENRGAPHSRNIGIKEAKYDLIALVDDDDEWLPLKLEKQVEVFEKSNEKVGLVYTWTDVMNENREVVHNYRSAKGFLGWGPFCTVCKTNAPRINSKRCMQCGNENEGNPGDEKLLRFLWENQHATPFEMAGMTIEVKAPIFIFREWHRHRTQSYNEMSARYTPLPDENYIPTVERLLMNSKTNKQAGTISTAEQLTIDKAEAFRANLNSQYMRCEREYQAALSVGVPKELARVVLPVGRYSRMMASTDLRNWLAFLTLRMAPNAQWEIRQYANAVGEMIEWWFPRTWKLFTEGRS